MDLTEFVSYIKGLWACRWSVETYVFRFSSVKAEGADPQIKVLFFTQPTSPYGDVNGDQTGEGVVILENEICSVWQQDEFFFTIMAGKHKFTIKPEGRERLQIIVLRHDTYPHAKINTLHLTLKKYDDEYEDEL
jgi:wobble nucleotide-excising tRNase